MVSAVGFSNGCAELALKIPPPFVPSSLIASCDAVGASAIVDELPSTPVTSTPACRLIVTPSATSTIAATKEIGSRTRVVPRTRSTQKLPIRSVEARTKPRTSATATAMPTAAETKFCTVSPAICTRWPMTVSGTYDCQFVLVTNEIAVLNAIPESTGPRSRLSGSSPCRRCSR